MLEPGWKDKPTSGGWYWVKRPSMYGVSGAVVAWSRVIVLVHFLTGDAWTVTHIGDPEIRKPAQCSDYEFYGPIVYPRVDENANSR